MKIIRALRYLPLIFMLFTAACIAFICFSGENEYSDSTFVFSNRG